jgi:hypothetical protein
MILKILNNEYVFWWGILSIMYNVFFFVRFPKEWEKCLLLKYSDNLGDLFCSVICWILVLLGMNSITSLILQYLL